MKFQKHFRQIWIWRYLENKGMEKGNWKSRKAKLAMGIIASSWITATAAFLALDKMTAAEWNMFQTTAIPILFGLYATANVTEAVLAKKK